MRTWQSVCSFCSINVTQTVMIMNHFYLQSRPEEKIKILEKKVNDLIEESCMAHANGDLQLVSKMLP